MAVLPVVGAEGVAVAAVAWVEPVEAPVATVVAEVAEEVVVETVEAWLPRMVPDFVVPHEAVVTARAINVNGIIETRIVGKFLWLYLIQPLQSGTFN